MMGPGPANALVAMMKNPSSRASIMGFVQNVQSTIPKPGLTPPSMPPVPLPNIRPEAIGGPVEGGGGGGGSLWQDVLAGAAGMANPEQQQQALGLLMPQGQPYQFQPPPLTPINFDMFGGGR